MAVEKSFQDEYKKLNNIQKEAVDSLSGPVMVVAGPGTGKTQVLAMRIANILNKTDIKADGILCLTFTNSAVEAMRLRLKKYVGGAGDQVNVFTFHSFGMKIIESHYQVLGLTTVPKLLDDTDTAILFNEVLESNDWEYLRPRSDRSRYFSDLRSLLSLMKRERITSKYFLSEIAKDVNFLENNEDNISTRGVSKGKLKKEVLGKIEGLERSREVAKFFDLYEQIKKNKNVLDYDDVLENLVKITETSGEAVSDIREQFLYVLVDEHQDSSRVQNEFLKNVWAGVESPDIFVVGDDRQLIYGFSGASIDHFQGFKKTFKDARLITLVDNYRSTQVILDASHALLQSVMTDKKLVSQTKDTHPIRLIEADSPEQEIVAAAQDIKEKIKTEVEISNCAILVPKNSQVRRALSVLHENGLQIAPTDALNLFEQEDAQAYLRVLKIISNPDAVVAVTLSFFDKLSGVDPLLAHKYITEHKMRDFSLEVAQSEKLSLFKEEGSISVWVQKLSKWIEDAKINDLSRMVEIIGQEILLNRETNSGKLVSGKEILDTVLALVAKEIEKNKELTLQEFMYFIDKLVSFGQHVPLITLDKKGVKVMTLHSSKGLEFDYVWIAHMDEGGLSGGKKMGFTLPRAIAEKVLDQDVDSVKRKLYVAITRAERFCTLSYALYSAKESEQELARIISDLPYEVFEKQKIQKNQIQEKYESNIDGGYVPELVKLVGEKYKDRYVSVSLLNNFFECPWKWYFRNLLQLSEEKSESLEFGSAVHEAIDKIIKLRSVILPEDKEIAKIVSLWAEHRLFEIAENRDSEKSVFAKDEKFPHLSLYGKIDLVEYLSNNEIRVTDFKTGSVRKKSDIEHIDEEGRMSGYLRQMAMYSYILERSSGLEVKEVRLEFLEAKQLKESLYDRVITTKEISLLVKDIADYDHSAKSGGWVNRPCNYNSYGKNTECEYCKMANIFK